MEDGIVESNKPTKKAGGTIAAPIPKKKESRELRQWLARKQTLEERIANSEHAMQTVMFEVFGLYESLLSDKIRPTWTAQVDKHCREERDSDGNVTCTRRGKYSWATLELCKREWLRTVFRDDAAEEQRVYMQFYLKYPEGEMGIREFFERMEELNRYLPLLPCLKDSHHATDSTTRMNRSFSEHKMAVIILLCIPRRLEDQYRLHHPTQPQKLLPLRLKLEDLKSMTAGRASLSKQGSGKGRSNDSKYNGKRQRTSSSSGTRTTAITSKQDSPTGKFCKLCFKFGGAKTNHNTLDCAKWDPQGNRKEGFGAAVAASKQVKSHSSSSSRKFKAKAWTPPARGGDGKRAASDSRSFAQAIKGFAKFCQVTNDKKTSGNKRKHGGYRRESIVSSESSESN